MNRRLYRCRDNRMIAGVSAGIAESFEVDLSIVRILWIISFLFGGVGLLAVCRDGDHRADRARTNDRARRRARRRDRPCVWPPIRPRCDRDPPATAIPAAGRVTLRPMSESS